MDQFPGLLARDFGLRPQGKAAPMSASKVGGESAARSGPGVGSPPLPSDPFSRGGGGGGGGGGLFGGRQGNNRRHRDDVDDIFGGGGGAAGFSSSVPVYDKPVYDDDDGIFHGVLGTKKGSSASTARRNDDLFGTTPYEDDLLASLGGARAGSKSSGGESKSSGAAYDRASPPYKDDLFADLGVLGDMKRSGSSSSKASPPYDDDLLSNLGGGKGSTDNKRTGGACELAPPSWDLLSGLRGVSKRSSHEKKFEKKDFSSLDDLIPGFGGSRLPKQKREPLGNNHQESFVSSTKPAATGTEDPFVVLETSSAKASSSSGLFTDPLERIRPSGSMNSNVSSAKDRGVFDDRNDFDGSIKSMPSFSFNMESNHDRGPLEAAGKVPAEASSVKASDDVLPRTVPGDSNQDSYKNIVGKSSKSSESYKTAHRDGDPNIDANANPYETSTKINASQLPEENCGAADDVWFTVSEIHLFTQPTSALPPSRLPPPLSFRTKPPYANTDEGLIGSNVRRKSNEYSSRQPSHVFPKSHNYTFRTSAIPSKDEFEDFAMGKPQIYADEVPSGEEKAETTSAASQSAAAMKEAMDRAEAKFKHAREVWEREKVPSSKNRESAQQIGDENEKEKERLDREQEQREREEEEQRRVEKMRELELEREREREKARQAVERANREARARAVAEARQKAERAARERAAVQRAQAEARERAAAEAKERAKKLAAERERADAQMRERAAAEGRAARERAAREKAAEAREKTERAAVERAAAEVRARAQRAAVERAAAEARERAAAMARDKQQKTENDLDSFFGMGSRANSAPRERSNSYFQNNGKPGGTQRMQSGSLSSTKRPSSTINIMDDLTSVFGTSSSEQFQEIEGEPEERRRARLEREQRTRERAAKALAEKNERELQMQREQAERDRVAESLNTEIRRWAAGKEGNLRALLSTLQYVLWPDSGWQPVSLTDLITASSVKKVYRKATLCVHPDKVRSGSVQQKYIAEKVFDLLKEAWNKFNSEELF